MFSFTAYVIDDLYRNIYKKQKVPLQRHDAFWHTISFQRDSLPAVPPKFTYKSPYRPHKVPDILLRCNGRLPEGLLLNFSRNSSEMHFQKNSFAFSHL